MKSGSTGKRCACGVLLGEDHWDDQHISIGGWGFEHMQGRSFVEVAQKHSRTMEVVACPVRYGFHFRMNDDKDKDWGYPGQPAPPPKPVKPERSGPRYTYDEALGF